MCKHDYPPEIREDADASITAEEVEALFFNFLMPEFAKLKVSFPSWDSGGIAVFLRYGSLVTSPQTNRVSLPSYPGSKDISELWSKVAEYAKTQGLDVSSHPQKGKPYTFIFNIHYNTH